MKAAMSRRASAGPLSIPASTTTSSMSCMRAVMSPRCAACAAAEGAAGGGAASCAPRPSSPSSCSYTRSCPLQPERLKLSHLAMARLQQGTRGLMADRPACLTGDISPGNKLGDSNAGIYIIRPHPLYQIQGLRKSGVLLPCCLRSRLPCTRRSHAPGRMHRVAVGSAWA